MDAGDARLAGEVWHPERNLQAGVVMIGGSGPTERSNADHRLRAEADAVPAAYNLAYLCGVDQERASGLSQVIQA